MTRGRDPLHGPLPRRTLAAFFEGEITPSEADEIAAHVRESGAARRQLDQLDEIRRSLARPAEAAVPEDAAIAALWRTIDREGAHRGLNRAGAEPAIASARARAREGARRGSRRLRRAVWTGSLALAALALLVVVRPAPPPAPAPRATEPADLSAEFVAKSVPAAYPEDRWVRLEILRVGSDGAARPLPAGSTAVHATEPLVVRYVSAGPAPLGYLVVFAIDARGEIHWYYPAYETAGTDPSSVAIRSDARAVALPDAISHALAAGPIVFYGVFTRAPLHVLDVERRVRALVAAPDWNPDLPPRLPIDGAGQHVIRATVVP